MSGLNLTPKQKEAVSNLRPGSVLYGGTGVGKTRTALAYYLEEICEGEINKANYYDLKREINLFVITTADKRDKKDWEMEAWLVLFPAEYNVTMVVDSWHNIYKYINVENSFFIFDEHKTSGGMSWGRAFCKIAKKNLWIYLTATPGDTWMDYMYLFIANGYYKNKTHFILEHVRYKPYRKYPIIDRYENTHILHNLRKQLLIPLEKEYIRIRRHIYLYVDRDLSLENEVSTNRRYKGERIKTTSEWFHKMRLVNSISNERLDRLIELVRNYKKIIVFYNFDDEREFIINKLNEQKISYGQKNGWKSENQEIPNTESWVYLVQYNAGAEAWNCIETNVIVFYSETYSYKQFEQSCGRIDRHNSDYEELTYFHFKSCQKLETAMYWSQRNKKNFSEKYYLAQNT